jgi:hypothetical protein
MTKLDALWNRARADLTIALEGGEKDIFLWEHSSLVARTAQRIAQLPEIRPRTLDESAVVAACLYHEAAWVSRVRDGQVSPQEVLCRSRGEAHRETSAMFMEERLAEILPPESLKRASNAIRTLNDRDIKAIESQVVTESKNLCAVGPLSMWQLLRRGALEGRGVQTVLDTWRRQKEYSFWTAHIDHSFRFEQVKEIARRRLASFEHLLEDVEKQFECQDVG